MRNKHQPYLYINLHNELKSYLANFKIYYSMYTEKRVWVEAGIICERSIFGF